MKFKFVSIKDGKVLIEKPFTEEELPRVMLEVGVACDELNSS